MNPVDYTVKSLKEGSIRFAAEQPENGKNHPRNLFIWRSNLLGSSGKGHEFMLKYLLGTEHGIRGKDLATGRREAGRSGLAGQWSGRQAGSGGYAGLPSVEHLSLFRHHFADGDFGTKKDDMNTSDMHPFIHRCLRRSIRHGKRKRLGNLQSHREEILRSVRRPSG